MQHLLVVFSAAFPIVIFIITLFPTGIFGIMFARETNHLGSAMLSFHQQVKNECKLPIDRDEYGSDVDVAEPKAVVSRIFLIPLHFSFLVLVQLQYVLELCFLLLAPIPKSPIALHG